VFDIVILNVPGSITTTPLAAPALLKGSIEKAGFTCRTVDYNIKLYTEIPNATDLGNYYSSGLNTEVAAAADKLIEQWAQEVVALDPKFVGISVFTFNNRIATRLFCKHIKKLSTTIKIVLGGQGLSDGGIQGTSGFARDLHKENLVDHWIRSEGEISIVELLKGNLSYPGIDSDTFQQVDNLDEIAFPNYDDYELDKYTPVFLPVTASRGCVYSCSFCDVHEHWKYKSRTGQNVADELMYLNQRYGISEFRFTDSVINGSLKEFRRLTRILAEYNRTTENPITWTSHFIVRPMVQVNEQYWKEIADSGGKQLAMGLETGSDSVRAHMNKNFTNADIDYTLEMLDKYNITCQFIIIVGYPTETEKDFQDTLAMLDRYRPLANRIVEEVFFGTTLSILPGTVLHHNAEKYNIQTDKYEHNWIAFDNPDLTLEKRLERLQYVNKYATDLGYTTDKSRGDFPMIDLLKNNLDKFNKRNKLKRVIKIRNDK
jgi:radical SAM superfamily enzyme YgiQ (UPF0313 family)